MIRQINGGRRWVRKDIVYPIREQIDYSQTIDKDELIKDIATIGFKATREKHGYSGNGVKHWCEQLGASYRHTIHTETLWSSASNKNV